MKIRLEKTTHGTKVFVDGKYAKRMPSKYDDVIKPKCLKNLKRKRLTAEERFFLEVGAFELKLRKENIHLYNMIKRSSPESTQIINPKQGTPYFVLKYKNGTAIKCNEELYWLSPLRLPTIKRNY